MQSSKTVFITRDLTSESPFYQRLSDEGWQVGHASLLAFEPVSFGQLPATDWIFFYSKNGIKYFFEQAKLDDSVRYAVMGKASAAYLTAQCGIQADYVGTGEPASTAAAFVQMAKGQRVLFPCAAQSRHSIRQLLAHEIEATDVVVYNNRKKTKFSPRDEHVLVFTSPLNVAAYFEQYTLQQYQYIIAIGRTTATALEGFGYQDYTIAAQPNETALAEAVNQVTPSA